MRHLSHFTGFSVSLVGILSPIWTMVVAVAWMVVTAFLHWPFWVVVGPFVAWAIAMPTMILLVQHNRDRFDREADLRG